MVVILCNTQTYHCNNHWLFSNITFVQWELVFILPKGKLAGNARVASWNPWFAADVFIRPDQTIWRRTIEQPCYILSHFLWSCLGTMMSVYLHNLGVNQNTDAMSLFWMNHDEAIEPSGSVPFSPKSFGWNIFVTICHNMSQWFMTVHDGCSQFSRQIFSGSSSGCEGTLYMAGKFQWLYAIVMFIHVCSVRQCSVM